jgi:hypothetical protein
MKDLFRTLIAALVGAVVAIAVVVGQPALAGQVDKAKAKKVTSAAIKDGTIRTKDLSAEVTGPLAKAGTALQSVPDGSVSTTKLANNAVTSAKIADNAVTNAKIADNAVTSAKLADNAVGSAEVTDHSLTTSDIALVTGSKNITFGTLTVNHCVADNGIQTGHTVTGDLIIVSQPAGIVGAITVSARESQSGPTFIDIVACNVGTPTFDIPAANYKWAVIAN